MLYYTVSLWLLPYTHANIGYSVQHDAEKRTHSLCVCFVCVLDSVSNIDSSSLPQSSWLTAIFEGVLQEKAKVGYLFCSTELIFSSDWNTACRVMLAREKQLKMNSAGGGPWLHAEHRVKSTPLRNNRRGENDTIREIPCRVLQL